MSPTEEALLLAIAASSRALCEVDEEGAHLTARGHGGQVVAERKLAMLGLRASLSAYDAAKGRMLRRTEPDRPCLCGHMASSHAGACAVSKDLGPLRPDDPRDRIQRCPCQEFTASARD